MKGVAVSVHEPRKLEIVRHAREDTRVLRRLLVVGLAWVCLCVPALARAGTVAIFYYPWYSTPGADGSWGHWDQNGHLPPGDVYSSYFPAAGPYSSGDPRIVGTQMDEIAAAGIDEVVVSWWGRGSDEDARLPLVVSAARRDGLLVGIHLEPYPGRTAETVADDLTHLAAYGVRDVYVYHPGDLAAADWAAVRAQAPPTMRLLAGTERVGFAAAARFDGVYTYDFVTYRGGRFARFCSQAHAHGLVCAPSVGPGYDGHRAGEPPTGRPRLNGATYDALWAAAVAAKPDVVSITSFNEWGEGTQIEPARAHRGYLDYSGAWGLSGSAARAAYLTRTAYWTGRFHGRP
jgi:glycoprotein endo-alpha-1,2-mannosidase